jgi:predicted dinucleotide-binding enzyme
MSTSPPSVERRPVADVVDVSRLVVGIHGGTGPQARGLAVRLAAGGQRVLLGSRDADRCAPIAAEVAGRAGAHTGRSDISVTGRLRNARQVEARTVNLLSVNRRYKVHAGVRITDV